MNRVCGIDPGKEGAIVFKDHQDIIPTAYLIDKLEFKDFKKMIEKHRPHMIYLEKAQAMAGQGVCSVFTYGLGMGRLWGWIESLSLPLTLIMPKAWQSKMHVGCTGTSKPKVKSLQAALRLFPEMNLMKNQKSKKHHEGIIDALLICEYGFREMNGIQHQTKEEINEN